LDLSNPASCADESESARQALEAAISGRSADVVALSWGLQQDGKVLRLARQSGALILLWAHPLDMQARSRHTAPLFTPVGRLKTKGGFGRNGTSCKEFRRLDRACTDYLLLVDATFEEAAEALEETVLSIQQNAGLPPAEREGLNFWIKKWKGDADANPKAAQVLVDAMARYILHLKEKGISPRTLSGLYSDFDAAGMLVFMYYAPKVRDVLACFGSAPCTFEFERKFTDSPRLIARYERNLEGFSLFLRQSGLIPDDDED
jgi:hypothetical protein